MGAGIAGMSAAVSAGRLGCKVALINDRPVVGGNNSSEIRVHLGGRIEEGTYKELGGLQKEFGPEKGGNRQNIMKIRRKWIGWQVRKMYPFS